MEFFRIFKLQTVNFVSRENPDFFFHVREEVLNKILHRHFAQDAPLKILQAIFLEIISSIYLSVSRSSLECFI